MNFQPYNRHILVEPIEEKKEKDTSISIVLPTDYEEPASPYLMCEVLGLSEDTRFYQELGTGFIGEKILVERRMLHKVYINEKTIYLVLENYVFGRITNETNKRKA